MRSLPSSLPSCLVCSRCLPTPREAVPISHPMPVDNNCQEEEEEEEDGGGGFLVCNYVVGNLVLFKLVSYLCR